MKLIQAVIVSLAVIELRPLPMPAQVSPDSAVLPVIGARVRFLTSAPDSEWRTGMFQRTRTEPACYVVYVRDDTEPPTHGLIRVRDLVRLQVSSTYDVRTHTPPVQWHSRDRRYPGEEWLEMPLERIVQASPGCSTQTHPQPYVDAP